MFGIIYIFVIAGLLLIGGIKAAGENVEGMKRGKERQRQGKNLQGTYYDRLGAERLLSTGQLASVYPDYSDPCDDQWLWVGAPGKKTRNMSEEQRKMRFDETKRIGKYQGRTVDVYDKRYWSTTGGNRYKVVIHGTFYRDLFNDKTYVCREFDLLYNPQTETFRLQKGYRKTDIEQRMSLKYYMDVETARLVRIADTQTLEYLYRTGDIIRRENFNYNSFINLSAEWREKEFQRLRYEKSEHTVFPDIKIIHAHPSDVIDLEEHKWDDRWYAEGQWWKDFKTASLYCIREIDGKYNGKLIKIECYMDISSGLLVRISDAQAKKSVPMDICDRVITDFNDKRKSIPKPKTLYEWNNYYLNHKIAKSSDYFYLREVLDRMNKDGCCPV